MDREELIREKHKWVIGSQENLMAEDELKRRDRCLKITLAVAAIVIASLITIIGPANIRAFFSTIF